MEPSRLRPVRARYRALSLVCASLLMTGCKAREHRDCPATDEACQPSRSEPGPATGRSTRVAPLGDGHLVAVTAASTPGTVRVVIFAADGAVRADVALMPPVVASGPRAAADPTWPAIAVRHGAIHVAWHDPLGGRLLHAVGGVASGLRETDGSRPLALAFGPPTVVDGEAGAAAGSHTALAIDDTGRVHLAYRHDARRALAYATRPAATDDVPSPPWRRELVPSCDTLLSCAKEGDDYGTFPAIALVPGGDGLAQPRIAFHDVARGDLRLAASYGDGRWAVTTLDGTDPVTGEDTGNVGAFASLALTPGRSLAVVYHDATAGTLRALTPGEPPRVLDDGRWTTADGRELQRAVGQFARLAITDNGVWHVVHLEADGPRWRYLKLAGERVTVAADLDGLPPGGWLDLAAEGDGLIGAYGAFTTPGSLATALRWFEVPAR